MLEELSVREKVTGLKQTRRAVVGGSAQQVYLACDADPQLTRPLQELCAENGIPTVTEYTMAQLGKACGIKVETAAAAVIGE